MKWERRAFWAQVNKVTQPGRHRRQGGTDEESGLAGDVTESTGATTLQMPQDDTRGFTSWSMPSSLNKVT